MIELSGRRIILGVTGSIAAYKAAIIARELIKGGAEVRVAMTPAASRFITPLTFASISRHPVAIDMYPSAGNEPAHGSWHIEWGIWGDAMVIAPASAATIGKLAAGITDNALTVIATALRGELLIAPAMDSDMYAWLAVERNLATLRSWGATLLPVGVGELASGLVGPGRMAEPEEIIEELRLLFAAKGSLAGRHLLITAGPTHERIDPVRFIGNYSSGRMGYAIADAARRRGARVTLVSGPTELDAPRDVEVVRVTSAEEMARAVDLHARDADVIVAAAAVADFTPAEVVARKMKRREMDGDVLTLDLVPTRDILRSVGQAKRPGQVIVGFALESAPTEGEGSDALVAAARAKLIEKNCDMIVANSAVEADAGFGVDTNRVLLVTEQKTEALGLMSKRECAMKIVERIASMLQPEGADERG